MISAALALMICLASTAVIGQEDIDNAEDAAVTEESPAAEESESETPSTTQAEDSEPLSLVSIEPNSAIQGTVSVEINVYGSGFTEGATLLFDGKGIKVLSSSFVSDKHLKLNIEIDQKAQPGSRGGVVQNPDKSVAFKNGILRIVGVDTDGDGVPDEEDAFPNNVLESVDTDGDGIPDGSDGDDDNDGVPDGRDWFPLDWTEVFDSDMDGIGDNADLDDDNDGVADEEDALPYDPTEWADSDGDGVGDNLDYDDDNDRVLDTEDAFPFDSSEGFDTDGDGIGDNSDIDDDNDGYTDMEEIAAGSDPFNALSVPEPTPVLKTRELVDAIVRKRRLSAEAEEHVTEAMVRLQRAGKRMAKDDVIEALVDMSAVVKELTKARSKGADTSEAMAPIVDYALFKAEQMINKAEDVAGTTHLLVEQARSEVEKAERDIDRGFFDKAVRRLTKSYRKANKAYEDALKEEGKKR